MLEFLRHLIRSTTRNSDRWVQVDGNDNVRNIKCLVLDTIEQNARSKIIKFRKTYVFSRKLTIALENMQLHLHIQSV